MNSISRTDNPLGYYGAMAENFRTGPGYKVPYGVGKIAYDAATLTPPKANEYLTTAYDAITSFADLPAQQRVAHHTRRKTPLVPDDPEKAAQVKELGGVLERSDQWNQGSAKAYSPQLLDAFGAEKRYFTPAEDSLQTVATSIFVDPITLFGGGLGLGDDVLKGGKAVQSTGKTISNMSGPVDWAEESLFTAVPMANQNPDAPKLDPYKESPEVYLDTSMGPEYIKTDDPRYDTAYQARLREERERRYKMRQGF
jgi:hypothetical protein